jgi:anti-anti-sigma factor
MAKTLVIQTDSQATIILEQNLVASEVPDLKRELKRLIGEGVTSIQLDCGHLEIIDSTGIGCLVAAHNSLDKVDGKLTLINVSSDIYDLLCSMRLDRRVKITQVTATRE